MKYVYASRTGNVKKLVKSLGLEADKIKSGKEVVDEDFILFTYTDGKGIVPKGVESFLKVNGNKLKGVVAAGNSARHADTFAMAGDIIAKEYGVECLYKLDGSPKDEDVQAVQEKLN